MSLIPIARARAHCKSDSSDAELQTYVDAAESICARYANRNFYVDQAALDAALATTQANGIAAFAAYDAALLTANALGDTRLIDGGRAAALNTLDRSMFEIRRTQAGMVAPESVISAMLLTLDNLYNNRGGDADSAKPPINAIWILDLYSKKGPL